MKFEACVSNGTRIIELNQNGLLTSQTSAKQNLSKICVLFSSIQQNTPLSLKWKKLCGLVKRTEVFKSVNFSSVKLH